MKCLILASGFGTRLYPLTLTCAKPLLSYKGKYMINHIVDKIPADIEIFINVNKKFEADFLDWQKKQVREVNICVEDVNSEEERLGAIGSLNYWIKNKSIREDLLLFGSDNYFEFDLAEFMAAYNRNNTLIAVYDVVDPSLATQYGVVKLEDKRIVEFEEKPSHPQSSLVATACYIIPSRVFTAISDFCSGERKDNLGSFVAYLIEGDAVYAYPFSETWIDIGNLEIYYSTK